MWCMARLSSDNQAQHTANSGQTKECQQPASANCRESWILISAHLSSLLRKSATWDNPTITGETFNQIKVKEGAPWPWCRRDISIIFYLSGAGLCHWISIHVSRYRYLEEKCSPAEVTLSCYLLGWQMRWYHQHNFRLILKQSYHETYLGKRWIGLFAQQYILHSGWKPK